MIKKSFRDVNKKLLALVSVGTIGAVCALAFAVGTLRLFERGYQMSGVFADSGGLKRGDEVRVAGVPAGRITEVRPDFQRGEIVIGWKMDRGIRLGQRTRADVELATLLGGRYLKLSGPVSAPYLHDLPESRRRIPADRTSVPFTVTDAVASSTRIAQRIDTKTVRKLLAQTAELDYPNRKQIERMLTNLNKLTSTLNEHTPDFTALLENSDKLTTSLAAKDKQLIQLLESAKILLDELVVRRDELSAALGRGSKVVSGLSQVIAARQGRITQLLDDLHLAADTLGGNLNDLNTSLALLAPTFQGLVRAGGTGPWIDAGPVGAVVLNPGFIGGTR